MRCCLFFVLNRVKYTNILKIIVVLFAHYKYMYYICIIIKATNNMKTNKYIDLSTKVSKRYESRNYINRFMHLLNIIAPNKYTLDTMNMLASIENKETQLTALTFSDNPFKI